jgi:hypothetical protein
MFQCDPYLDCNAHIEAHFYTSKVQLERVEMCCHCVGEFVSPVELHSSLMAPGGPYFVMLLVCQTCLEHGRHVIVRAARQNARAKQDKIDVVAPTEAAR